MHPQAAGLTCEGEVIDSHTIQRKGPLSKIIGVGNHVCHLVSAPESGFTVEEIGWKQASVFPGYCGKHDSEVFSALEAAPFTGTKEQCVLQAYRNVCNELYKKRALVESLEFQRKMIDRGCNPDEQITRQLSLSQHISGQMKSREELEGLWRRLEHVVATGQYDLVSNKCYAFKGELCVASAGALSAEFDFNGKKLFDMWDLNLDAEMLAHSIMATDQGGVIVFTWFADDELPASVVSSFDGIPDIAKGDVFIQYCFLNCENTYFSRAWWDQLGSARQAQLKNYAGALFYEGGAIVPNLEPLVGWEIIS